MCGLLGLLASSLNPESVQRPGTVQAGPQGLLGS